MLALRNCVLAVELERRLDRLEQPLGDVDGVAAGVVDDRSSHSTVNSSPPNRATVSPGRTARAQARPSCDQQLVAGVVAEAVVDDLEPVEVEEQHGQTCRGGDGPGQRQLQELDEQHPVRQPGQRVVLRLVGEAVLERFRSIAIAAR